MCDCVDVCVCVYVCVCVCVYVSEDGNDWMGGERACVGVGLDLLSRCNVLDNTLWCQSSNFLPLTALLKCRSM